MGVSAPVVHNLKGRVPRPILDKIVVRPFEPDEKTEGGIVLPDTAQEKPRCGVVHAVGPGAILDDGSRGPMEVKRDDVVVFSVYAGVEVHVGGVVYLSLRQDEVTCILEEPETGL